MTCLPAGRFFLLAFSFAQLFPPSALPSALPLPPPAAVVFRRGTPAAAGGGSFIFSKGGRCGHRPPFASPRGTFLPGGAMRKFWRGGGSSRSFFPPSAHPLPPPAAVVCRSGALTAAGGGFFIFSKGGVATVPLLHPPEGFSCPAGPCANFGGLGARPAPFRCCGVPKRYPRRKGELCLPCLGMRKARKQMLPGFCVTPNSRSSSSPSAGSCGRCAPPWGRCPGSTAPGRPCRR